MTNGVDNRVMTATAAQDITGEADLTFDSETLSIGADDDGTATIQRTTHADDTGGNLSIQAGNATGTDKAGGTLELKAGLGTGEGNTSTGGDIRFYTAWPTRNDFIIYQPGTAQNDYFTIRTSTHGATDIRTIDSAASAADLTFNIDGDIELNGRNFSFHSILSDFKFGYDSSNIHAEIAANTLSIYGTTAKRGDLKLYEDADNGTNSILFRPPDSIASDKTITLPDTTGTVALTSDIPALSVPVTVAQGGTGLTTVGSNYLLTGNGTSALTAESNCTFGATAHTFRAGFNGAKWQFGSIYGSGGFPSVLTSTIGANAIIDGYSLFGTPVASMIKFDSPGVGLDAGDCYIEAAHAQGTNKQGADLILVGGSSTGSDPGGRLMFYGGASGGGSGTTQRVPTLKFTVDGDGNTSMSGDLTVTGGDITIGSTAGELVSTGQHIHKQTKVTIDQAGCNALNSSPQTLVAAQGANKIIIPVEVICLVDRNSADTSLGDLIVGWNSTTSYTYALKYARRWMYGILTDMTFVLGTYAGKGAASLTGGENVPLTIATSTGMTTNSLTSMTVYTSYYVIDNS
jgi:hypothetical protein